MSQFSFDKWSVSEVSSGTSQINVIKRKNYFRGGGKSIIVVSLHHTPSVPPAFAKLASLDDLIAKYTATPQAKAVWDKVNKELHQELYADVLSGKLNKVKYYRIINKMDQKTLAKLSGIQQPNISRIEKTGYVANPGSYKKIAKVFGIDYKELLP